MVQDGTVEGHVLTTSSKSSKIATNCWTTIGRRTLEPNKKRYLMSKNKEEATVRQWEGKQSWKNQIPYPPSGWPTDWRTIISKSLHCCEGSEPQVRFPSLRIQKRPGNPQGIWPWGPGGFDYRTSRGLGETPSSRLGGYKQNFAHTKTQRRGAVTPQKTEPKLPPSVGGPPLGQ